MARVEVTRIEEQLRRSVEGDAWHGPALLELLQETPVDMAPARPLDHAHSIWEITLHVSAWLGAIARRTGGEAIELKDSADWPPVTDVSEQAWNETLDQLRRNYEKLHAAIRKLDDAQLLQPAPGRDHDVYFMLHGLIQHNLYHAGQIALLRKASR